MPGGRPKHPDILTPAELRVFEGVRRGLTNGEIADELGISLNTVKYHVSNILGKLGVATREDLAAMSRPRRWWSWLLSTKVGIATAGSAVVAAMAIALAVVLSHDGGGAASAEPRTEPTGTIAFVMVNADGRGTQIGLRPAAASCAGQSGSCPGGGFPAQQSDQIQLWPTWSPSGDSTAWIEVPPGASAQPGNSGIGTLMVGGRDGQRSAIVADHVSVLVASGAVPRPAWRPDGTLIEFTSQDFIASIVAPDGSGRADQILGCVTGTWAEGGRVGLCSVFHDNPPDPGPTDLTLWNDQTSAFRLPGQTQGRSLTVPGTQVQPVLSDDGAWLAWWGYKPGELPHVYAATVRPDRQIGQDGMVDLGPGQVPEFAPGSHRLVFSTTTDLSFPPVLATGDIVTVDLDSQRTTHLTNAGANRWPTWSPDGQWIAFVSDRDEPHGELYIMRSDGADVRRLTSNEVAESMPDWTSH